MGKLKIRYLVVKPQKGHPIFYWQPNKALREAGFLPRRIAERTNDIVDAVREAEDLNAQLDAWRSGAEKVAAPPGSLPWLIRLYRADHRYTDLRDRTRGDYESYLRRIEAWSDRAGHPPITTISRKDVKAFSKSMAATPVGAKAAIGVLRTLFAFAIDEGELATNPAINMRMKGHTPRHQVWRPEQIAALIDHAVVKGRPSIGLAVALAHNTGQREADVLHMAWSQFDGAKITLKQRKTGVLLDVPCTQQLLGVLATTPRTGTLMVIKEASLVEVSIGGNVGTRVWPARAYERVGFTKEFRKMAKGAGIPDDLQFRDLRRTAVVTLAEAGCSVPEIAAISGHSIQATTRIMEVYCPRNSTMAGHAITKLEDYRRTQQERKLEV